jgi:tRNA pseudouridine32 synthase/23S rRNA pseudouridine746 synthase
MEPYNPPREPWLHVLYRDMHIMVVNKPSGLLSVPGRAAEHHDSVISRVQAIGWIWPPAGLLSWR